jgi:hypothetical protein
MIFLRAKWKFASLGPFASRSHRHYLAKIGEGNAGIAAGAFHRFHP